MGKLSLLVLAIFATCSFISGEVKQYKFPPSFIFGAATASYQIEGSWNVDGKLPSIWDTATHRVPNGVFDGSTGDDAAKSYIYYEKDIKILKDVDFKMYRFSIAWTRVLTKNLEVNQKGIDYYNKLIDGLIREGIEPMITIYHWDLPQYLQDLGGWMNSEIIKYYEHYADLVFKSFGDRVKIFITFNEPSVFCDLGHNWGEHAPHVVTADSIGGILCSHNVLLSHAAAYKIYKEKYFNQYGGKVGICLNSGHSYPGFANVTWDVANRAIEFGLGRYAHPIFTEEGDYPEIMRSAIDSKSTAQGRPFSRLPKFTTDQIESLKGSADFLALNYYSSSMVYPISHHPDINPIYHDSEVIGFPDPSWKRARSAWLYQVPQGLHDHLHWIKDHYNNPIVYISENGWSDEPMLLNDTGRVEYLTLHLAAISRAISGGCDVRGYTAWSLIDNFEWMRGYDERFGIFAIDLNDPERERIRKKSVDVFENIIKNMHIEADENEVCNVNLCQSHTDNDHAQFI